MSARVTKLPTAATSYYTVNKAGRHFDLVLVTPCPGKNLKTTLMRFADLETALAEGKDVAARMQRPFKQGRRVAK